MRLIRHRRSRAFLALMALISVSFSGCGLKENAGANDKGVASDRETGVDNKMGEKPGGIKAFDPNETISVNDKELTVHYPVSDESEGGELTMTFGDEEVTVFDYCEFPKSAYLVPGEGQSFYVLVQAGYSNDWVSTSLVEYDGEKELLLVLDETDGAIAGTESFVDDTVILETRVDIFGTYGVTIPTRYDKSGFTAISDYIAFTKASEDEEFAAFLKNLDGEERAYYENIYDEQGRNILVLKQAIRAYPLSSEEMVALQAAESGTPQTAGSEAKKGKMADEDSVKKPQVSGELKTIPKASKLYPLGCDRKEQKFYFEMDGETFFVTYKYVDGYLKTIDGVEEDDVFEVLPYAG